MESFVREGSSLLGRQAFLWRRRYPYGPTYCDCQAGVHGSWTEVAYSNHPMWDGVGFTLSLSTDEDIPEVVHLDWVEKDRVLGGGRVGHACQGGGDP
jgi:hypothetical protein